MQKMAYNKFILKEIRFTKIFKALSDENRLRIIKLLLDCPKSICVCEIVDALKLPQYQVSKQLNILKNAGLVQCESRGKWAYYSLSQHGDSVHASLFKFIKEGLKNPKFAEDQENLRARLFLREGDFCIVGFTKKRRKNEKA